MTKEEYNDYLDAYLKLQHEVAKIDMDKALTEMEEILGLIAADAQLHFLKDANKRKTIFDIEEEHGPDGG